MCYITGTVTIAIEAGKTFGQTWNLQRSNRIGRTILLCGLLVSFSLAGYADTTYALPDGQKDAGKKLVSASAILSLSEVGSEEFLTITLNNLTVNQSSDGENITGIKLGIDTSEITGITGGLTSSADLIDVGSHGVVNDLGTGSLSHWTAATSLSDIILTTVTGGAAKDAIIGAPGPTGTYSNANSSIISGTKQPYAMESAVFTIYLLGSNISLASFTGVQIGFGTVGNNYIDANIAPATGQQSLATPEPGTFWLLALSVMVIGLVARRNRMLSRQAQVEARPARLVVVHPKVAPVIQQRLP